MPSELPILQVEDEEHDIFFLRHAFEEAGIPNRLCVATDGQQAMDYLAGVGKFADRHQHPLPCLIILDLKMPRRTGHEFLIWLRKESRFPALPVIVLSSSGRSEDIQRSYLVGANAFVVKPSSVADRVRLAQAIRDFWLSWNEIGSALD